MAFPKTIDAAIFDLDGTLLDFEGASGAALNKAVSDIRLPGSDAPPVVTRKMHCEILGTHKDDWSPKILAQLGVHQSLLSPHVFAQRWTDEMAICAPKLQLMPGAEELLQFLKAKGTKMAIATSSIRSSLPSKINSHPVLKENMEVIVCGDEVAKSKPFPDIFLSAAEKLGVSPNRCIVFEDAPSGVKAGHAAGMKTCAVIDSRFNDGNHEWLNLATITVSNLHEAIEPVSMLLA